MSKVYILHHGQCYDGYGAAYSAWKKFGDEAVYKPCIYGKPIPEVPSDATVYMIDYSGSREEIEQLYDRVGGRLTIIDHHKTAEAALKGLPYAIFDMTKSGALMAWEYFHPGVEVPKLIQHISDRDLWEFKLAGTHEVHAALLSHPMNFKVWDSFDMEQLKKEGEALLRVSNQTTAMICDKAYWSEIAGHKVVIVNATSHWSEVGNKLCKMYPESPFCASYYTDKDGTKWSLRSVGDFDVSAIAKQFGGGGHKNAAGYVVKVGN